MADLRSFRALRYGPQAGSPAVLLAPPYDVIEAGEAGRLRAASPYNAVHLVLPEGDGSGRYDRAAETLRAWQASGMLVAETPSAYLYRQTFELDGRRRQRLGVFLALRLTPYDTGTVLPHERTHSGAKADRLALTLACETQLSPIFLIGSDPTGSVREAAAGRSPEAAVLQATTPDGVDHELWRIPEGPETRRLCAAHAGGSLLVADGHHRYETALEVKRHLADREAARFVTACIVDREDPGLHLAPTHRALLRPPAGSAASWAEALRESFAAESSGAHASDASETVAGASPPGTLVLAEGDAIRVLRPRPEALRRAGIRGAAARISSVLVDGLVLPLLGLDADEAAGQGVLTYHRSASDCRRAARAHGGAALILPPLELDDVWQAVREGTRMPPKTTYFAPKIPSGLLFRPL
ncbi:MAG: DUF1015 family protein [Gemmatimonadota bacterium]